MLERSTIPAVRRRARPLSIHSIMVATALLLHASVAAATPLISEVFYDAVGSDDGWVFVELAGVPGTPLDGLFLEGVNGSNGAIGPVVVLEGVIGDDGLFVVADRTSDGTTSVLAFDLLANFDFQNGPDSIRLTDGDAILDAVAYGDFSAGEVFAGEGMPTLDVAPGWSLARVYADVDSNDNAADFMALETPTPGSADFFVVPEPGSGLLTGTGLLVLGWLRRRDRHESTRRRC